MQGHVYGQTTNEHQRNHVFLGELTQVTPCYHTNMLYGPNQVVYGAQVHVYSIISFLAAM